MSLLNYLTIFAFINPEKIYPESRDDVAMTE